jgi:hypothetical protein
LHHGAALRILPVVDALGDVVGYILGYAQNLGGKVVKERFSVSLDQAHSDFERELSRSMAQLAGRYLVVIVTGSISRVYGDPVLDLPVLIDARSRKVASSLGLILDRPIQPDTDFRARLILSGQENLSLQRTLDVDVRRAVSNHYLDLASFTFHRYWLDAPLNDPNGDPDLDQVSRDIAERLSQNVAGWINEFTCSLPVTGGRDSRIILAAALPVADKVNEFPCHRFHNPSRKDAKAAKQILKSVNLTLKQHFKKASEPTTLRDMRLKMGWSGFRGELAALSMIKDYPKDNLILRGNILELMRANQWRTDNTEKPFNYTHAIRRLGISASKGAAVSTRQWQRDYDAWLDGLPESARANAYDIAWLEHSLPNYQVAYINGFEHMTMLNPFNDRYLISKTLSIPPKTRKQDKLVQAVLKHLYSPFLEFPFS